jgi:chitinase
MSKPIITAYWGGYFNSPQQTLDKCPKYVDIVMLAFIGPLPNSTAETTFLCSKYSKEQIKGWIKEVQSRGTKVLMSILDTPQTHWNVVDFEIFGNSLREIMEEWGVDGFDIDAESGMPGNVFVEKFVELINCVRNIIGNDKLLTYTCYTGDGGYDGPILTSCKDKIDFLQTMAYFDSFEGMRDLYNYYSQFMENNICIGVKAGNPEGTPIDEVKKICTWNSNKKGIMLWTFNRDNPNFTKCPEWTWSGTINYYLKEEPLISQCSIQ